MVTAVPLLLASLLMFNRLVANDRENLRQGLLVNAKTLAGLVENEIDKHAAIAATLARSPALQSGDLNAFWREAKAALEFVPGSWIHLVAPDGKIVLTTLHPFGTPLPEAPEASLVAAALAEKKSKVGNLLIGSIDAKPRAVLVAPVFRNGQPAFGLAISLVPERFLRLITEGFPPDAVAAVLDGNKAFIARIPDHAKRVGTLASEGLRAALARSPQGTDEFRTLEGELSIQSFATTRYGWSAAIAQLESRIRLPQREILWSSLLVFGLLAALSFVLAILIARHASRGMSALAAAAREVGAGRRIEDLPTPFAEAKAVADALASASAELERRGEALGRANTELEAKVEQRTHELMAEMKRREVAEATLRQAQKIETIGQLTGGIAHDFNNMLTVIMGNLDTARRRLNTLDNAAVLVRPIDAALQGARNAAKLTHRLLAFSRQQALEPVALNLNSLIAGVADMLVRTVGETVKVETVLGAGLWTTFADANQVESSLINLIVNAKDAMPDGGKLTIETSNAFLDEAYVAAFGDLKPGQYVMLSVTDTGHGIAPAMLEKVFEPFFTTKGPGKGTGLGLAMVHGFVKQSGGHIRVYSEVDEGTTVKIYLPRLVGPLPAKAVPFGPVAVNDVTPRRANPGETVLLVEDDLGVREYAIGVLEDLGYRVVAAEDGSEALKAFEAAERVDLLFTDVVLGGSMNGRQLAEAIKARKPGLPVLFTTGYTRNAIVHQGRLDAGVHLLSKPYTQRDIAEKVRALIDSHA
jgi:signal transduction histidine kinase/ActR/RegA family two-component response regulator